MPFVIDNSVVIGWHLSRWATAYSDAVLRALVNDNAHVPALWVFEFSNVMHRALLAKKITEARCRESLQLQQGLALTLHANAGDPSENLALRYQLSSYDAACPYLVLRHAPAGGDSRWRATGCRSGLRRWRVRALSPKLPGYAAVLGQLVWDLCTQIFLTVRDWPV